MTELGTAPPTTDDDKDNHEMIDREGRRLTLVTALPHIRLLPSVGGGMDLQLINSQSPTQVRTFDRGRFELYKIGPMTLGRAIYEPGWKWSEHVGQATGETSCQVEHVGLVMSGQAVAKMNDGREVVMRPGDFFYVPPGHDSWVVGEEPYVSLHILGSEDYATT